MPNIRQRLGSLINGQLSRLGFQYIKLSEVNDLLMESGRMLPVNGHRVALPEGANDYLQPTNNRLIDLKQKYENHSAATHSQWTAKYLDRELLLKGFRGDGAYLYQGRLAGESRYILTTYYIKTIDHLGLLAKLQDDDLFGNQVIVLDGKTIVSRDLLDSVLEINFLEGALGISGLPQLNVLDIGAGYGRLAHRLVTALPNIQKVFCSDAIPESTFLCEYYLKFRGVQNRAVTVPIYEVESTLEANQIDLAINIHSFPECSITSIRWWLDLLRMHRVKYVFLVDREPTLLSSEKNDERLGIMPELEARGYSLVVKQPKYGPASSVQKHGVFPAYYFLFQLSE